MGAKKIWTPDELVLASVLSAVSSDETRPHLCKPFGKFMAGRGYLVGTDGHRLHAVASDNWQAHNRDAEPFPPPPAEQVIPWDSHWIGEFPAGALADARHFPVRWDTRLEIGPNGQQRLFCGVRTGSGKKAARVYPFGRGGVAVDWGLKLEQITFTFGINLPYLLDAVDCVGEYGVIHVWAPKPNPKYGAIGPIAFTRTSKPLREQERIAVVMPCRV